MTQQRNLYRRLPRWRSRKWAARRQEARRRVMALFGYPVAQDNDAERLVRAVLSIQRALAELNRKNEGAHKCRQHGNHHRQSAKHDRRCSRAHSLHGVCRRLDPSGDCRDMLVILLLALCAGANSAARHSMLPSRRRPACTNRKRLRRFWSHSASSWRSLQASRWPRPPFSAAHCC